MRICLVGPTYPLRGGIAHHTTLLCRHLRTRHEVRFYAFKRQYPKWLFPGESDQDHSTLHIAEEGAERILDSLNPLTWLEVSSRIRKDQPDLVIIPWWVSFWTPQFWTIATMARRSTRAGILFICHNVVAHESRWIDGICNRMVLRTGHRFLVHSDEDMLNLKRILPEAKVTKVPHPTYDVFDFAHVGKDAARQKLGLDGHTLLFFGFIRPYKGLRTLLRAIPLIRRCIDVRLLVVGEFWEKEEQYHRLIGQLDIRDCVTIVDRYVPNEEVELYFAACDAVVLPYVSGTGSGIAQMAYGLGKPVIATRVGCLPDVVEDGVTGLLVAPNNPEELARAVIRFYEEGREAEFSRQIAARREVFSWDRMVEAIESVWGEAS